MVRYWMPSRPQIGAVFTFYDINPANSSQLVVDPANLPDSMSMLVGGEIGAKFGSAVAVVDLNCDGIGMSITI